ncbi:MAG: DUF4340 domain-containing protein, partial [candidate division Zixibacteria bacterium]|nr:DUF4340 domain-containing protein [candidate division Zixibacteria bacterium]
LKITGIFAGVALVLAILAFVFLPGRITPEAFMDQGEKFFPQFTDPNQATTLEVIEFDEQSGSTRPFKVTFNGGRWTIPSHYDYPADGKDRLARTAAGVIDIKKDDYRTNVVADHEACGVIDPMDQTAPGLKGRGSRITLKGEGGNVLADFIIGKTVPEREGFRFVRIPGENRVYASRVDLDISTRFADWIEASLLETQANKIQKIALDNYSVNERTASIQPGEKIELDNANDVWTTRSLVRSSDLDTGKVRQLARTLGELKIVGVRPKPKGLSTGLKGGGSIEMTQEDQLSLQSKGFYLARQDGRLLSNEGDVKVYSSDGIIYTLRFGEVLYGSGLEVSAGQGGEEPNRPGGEQSANRYLFVTCDFDPRVIAEPPKPASMEFQNKPDSAMTPFDRECREVNRKHQEWERKVQTGRELSDRLNARFADWYYVISDDSFKKIHLSKAELTKS